MRHFLRKSILILRSFNVFFDLRLNKWLSKQSWGWWFETQSHPLWRHRNKMRHYLGLGLGPHLYNWKHKIKVYHGSNPGMINSTHNPNWPRRLIWLFQAYFVQLRFLSEWLKNHIFYGYYHWYFNVYCSLSCRQFVYWSCMPITINTWSKWILYIVYKGIKHSILWHIPANRATNHSVNIVNLSITPPGVHHSHPQKAVVYDCIVTTATKVAFCKYTTVTVQYKFDTLQKGWTAHSLDSFEY